MKKTETDFGLGTQEYIEQFIENKTGYKFANEFEINSIRSSVLELGISNKELKEKASELQEAIRILEKLEFPFIFTAPCDKSDHEVPHFISPSIIVEQLKAHKRMYEMRDYWSKLAHYYNDVINRFWGKPEINNRGQRIGMTLRYCHIAQLMCFHDQIWSIDELQYSTIEAALNGDKTAKNEVKDKIKKFFN